MREHNTIKKFGALQTKGKISYIEQLIAGGENQQLDFKFEISDSRKIARSLTAFANTDGGKLLVGVKDNGAIAGVRSEEEYYMVEAAAALFCQPEIHFLTHEHNVHGKTILEISINKSQGVKHKAHDKNNIPKYYIRVGDQNLLAHPIQLLIWKLREQPDQTKFCISENERKILEYMIINKKTDYGSLIKTLKISKFKTNHILALLIYFDIIRLQMTEKELFLFLNDKIDSIEKIGSFKKD